MTVGLCANDGRKRHHGQAHRREAQRKHAGAEQPLSRASPHEGTRGERHREHGVASGDDCDGIAGSDPAKGEGEELAANPAGLLAELREGKLCHAGCKQHPGTHGLPAVEEVSRAGLPREEHLGQSQGDKPQDNAAEDGLGDGLHAATRKLCRLAGVRGEAGERPAKGKREERPQRARVKPQVVDAVKAGEARSGPKEARDSERAKHKPHGRHSPEQDAGSARVAPALVARGGGERLPGGRKRVRSVARHRHARATHPVHGHGA